MDRGSELSIAGTKVAPGTKVRAINFIGNSAFKPLVISSGTYNLMWDIAKSDLPGA